MIGKRGAIQDQLLDGFKELTHEQLVRERESIEENGCCVEDRDGNTDECGEIAIQVIGQILDRMDERHGSIDDTAYFEHA